jgi:hypothetical protein
MGRIRTAANSIYTSPYKHRVQLVAHALEQHSKLGEKRAAELAVHVLHAIDHIPEKVVRQLRSAIECGLRASVARGCLQSRVLLEEPQPAAPIESADPDDGHEDD